MPPKGKKNKKQDDDWEAEALGETADPIAAATAEAKAADAVQDGAEDDAGGGGGGLMASLRKNKDKRAKKGKAVQNDFVEGEDAAGAGDATAAAALENKAPEEADADDIFAAPVKGKGGKGKQQEAAKDDADEDDAEAGGGDGGRVKTKKEKEKEKKEREKQRKKEQAAKKKSSGPAQSEQSEAAKADEAKKKQEEEEEEEEEAAAAAAAAAAAPAGKDAKGSKKKIPAHLAALQKQMEERRKQEEELKKLQAEEEERVRELERQEQEKAKADTEAKARKKEREKEKKEELRKQGLLLTKAQREAKRAAEARKQQMLDSGMLVEALEGSTESAQAKKKPVYEKKKKGGVTGPSKAEEEARRLEEARLAAEAEAERLASEREAKRQEELRLEAEAAATAAAAGAGAADPEAEDWEAAADAADDDVKDSWDAETDDDDDEEEEEEEKAAAVANGKAKVNGGAARAAATASVGRDVKQLPVRAAKKAAANQESSDDDDDDDSSSEEDEGKSSTQLAAAKRKAEAAARRQQQHDEAMAARSRDNLRSPICCILGHVDTGKTKLLDKIRQTNVQEGEAGGITQQIGATFFPVESLQQKTAVVNRDGTFEFKIPGLLVIDTPGHESFTNLRSRGSSLCNIAILVVDIMHGLEPQTLESMRLLRDRKTPFIVALNKIDRLYGWRKIDNNGFEDSLALQNKAVQQEFRNRVEQTKLAFAEQGFNSELFYENRSMARNVSLVPTSAHTGEGIPDMIKLITQLTQERMTGKLMYLSEVECTVLEVKVIEGLGTTIDVVLSNGVLREGDRIVLCGVNDPITTNIRALLTPQPMKELRVKSQYVHHQEVRASLGVKIAANELEHAIAGSRLLVVGPDDDEKDLEEEVMADIENLLNRVSKTGRGVSVQASTLGSLEALLEFLKVSKIPVANIGIGPVYKRDVMQAGIMLEKAREYAVMLCFDVKVDPAAQQYAEEVGVKIFQADIIYHLFDNFTAHMARLAEQRKEESKMLAVFPCVLKPVAVFNKKDPIVVGVDVVEGALRPLTPIAVVKTNAVTNVKEILNLGRVTSIERDHKQIPICKKGQPSVAVKIEGANQPMYGRQLEEQDTLYSQISRVSIDTLKEFYRSDVSNDEWLLIKKMKPLFDIP